MRYDTAIYFQQITQGAYNRNTGDYGAETVKESRQYASVMDTSAVMLQIVYGKVKQGSLTIQIQEHYNQPFEWIRIGNKRYQVDSVKTLRSKQIFVVSEVQ